MMSVFQITQLTVTAQSRPGVLAKVARTLNVAANVRGRGRVGLASALR